MAYAMETCYFIDIRLLWFETTVAYNQYDKRLILDFFQNKYFHN